MAQLMPLLCVALATLTVVPAMSRGRAQLLETVSVDASLSDSTAIAAGRSSKPVAYFVDLGVSFASTTDLTFFFVFAPDDLLDEGECLGITGDYPGAFGFCAVGPDSETERTLTFPCETFPEECAAYLDGSDAGLLTASRLERNPAGRPSGRASISIESFTVTVSGVLGPS